jgi:hypothetical protein
VFLKDLNFKQPLHTWTHVKKTFLEIQYVFLGNKEICCTFKTCIIICFLFFKKFCYFIMISFPIQIILTFFINHTVKFKY